MLGLIKRFAQWPWPLKRMREGVSNVWVQFRFENDSLFDEVTETEMQLFGNARVKNDELRVDAAGVANYAEFNPITFEDNEDFYIRCSFSSNTPSNSWFNQTILCQWGTVVNQQAWGLWHQGPATYKDRVSFGYTDSAGTYRYILSTEPVSYSEMHLVEVVRKNGTITLYIDGVDSGSMYVPLGTVKQNLLPNRLFNYRHPNVLYTGGGRRDDIQIIKGEFDFEPGMKPALAPYVRSEYFQHTADKIIAQYGFRRNSLVDEAGSGEGQLFGTASINMGRIRQTAATASYFQLPIKKFGEGDFTVELMVKLSSVHATYGCVILGHWKAGAQVSDDNRWALWVNSAGQISWNQARSSAANSQTICMAPTKSFTFNVDQHIVVERIDNIVTIYVNGKSVASSDEFDFAIRGEAPFYARSLSTQNAYTMAGEVWNIRIADTALYKGSVKTSPTFPAFPTQVVAPWNQFLFWNNERYDEVSGRPLLLSSASISNNKLVTSSSYTSKAEFDSFFPEENEDFTIELKFNCVSTGNQGAMLLGVWNNGGLAGNSWNIAIRPDDTVSFNIPIVDAPDSSIVTSSTVKITRNEDHHIALVRKSGMITLYLDGKAVASKLHPNAFLKQNRPVSTSWSDSNGWMNGTRWDIRLVKGKAEYTGDFEPEPLQHFVRRTYTEEEIANVLRQYSFRENQSVDEIADVPISVTGGASVTNGFVTTTTSASSRYTMPMTEYFGDGDFTIEFKINVSTKTGYFYVLAQWYGGGSQINNAGNSWGVTFSDDMRPGIIANGNGSEINVGSDIAISYNTDHHIVFERVDGILNIYVDGQLGKSAPFDYTLRNITNTIASYATSGAGGYAARKLWDIRIAKAAMYRGKIPKLNYLPKTLVEMSLDAFEYQVLGSDEPLFQEVSDQHLDAFEYQVLLDDQSLFQEVSDQHLDAFEYQILVKE